MEKRAIFHMYHSAGGAFIFKARSIAWAVLTKKNRKSPHCFVKNVIRDPRGLFYEYSTQDGEEKTRQKVNSSFMHVDSSAPKIPVTGKNQKGKRSPRDSRNDCQFILQHREPKNSLQSQRRKILQRLQSNKRLHNT